MAISCSQITVATTATLLADASNTSIGDKMTVIVKGAAAAIAVGGSGVTFAQGMPMATTDSLSIDLGPGDSLYGIASGSSTTVFVLKSRSV